MGKSNKTNKPAAATKGPESQTPPAPNAAEDRDDDVADDVETSDGAAEGGEEGDDTGAPTPPAVATGPKIVAADIQLPLVDGTGYAPRVPDLHLTHEESLALRDLAQGLEAAGEEVEGRVVHNSATAIRWIARQILAARK